MSEHDISMRLHDAVRPSPALPDAAMLWNVGRRRRRDTVVMRVGGVAVIALVIVAAAALVGRSGGDTGGVVDVVGSSPATAAAADNAGSAPSAAADLESPADFPITMALGRSAFAIDDGGAVEVQLSPRPGRAVVPVSIAIPLTLQSWDASESAWVPTYDLYDSPQPGGAYWQPHAPSIPRSYSTVGPWGVSLRLPVTETTGTHRVCLQGWLPADPPTHGTTGTTQDQAVPESAVTMCRHVLITDPTAARPAAGTSLGSIRIPSISVDQPLVQGDTGEALWTGPAHVAATPMCGQAGNTVIVGHRTTVTAPFRDLDELVSGDRIEVTCGGNTFAYAVSSTRILDPGPGPYGLPASIVDARGSETSPMLTLVTFEPEYSAAQRLVIEAVMIR